MDIDWIYALKVAGFGISLVFSILVLLVLTTWTMAKLVKFTSKEGSEEENNKSAKANKG